MTSQINNNNAKIKPAVFEAEKVNLEQTTIVTQVYCNRTTEWIQLLSNDDERTS